MSEAGHSGMLHASCVAWEGRAVLIRGRSGSGKSALALQLMAYGATLVADDRTQLRCVGDMLIATSPESIRGLIEARGVGLLRAQSAASGTVVLVVDMEATEPDRLPVQRSETLCGVDVACIGKVPAPHFPAAVLQYLKAGRRQET